MGFEVVERKDFNPTEITYYIKSDTFLTEDSATKTVQKIIKNEAIINELQDLVLNKQYLHTTDLRIKLERILGKQDR